MKQDIPYPARSWLRETSVSLRPFFVAPVSKTGQTVRYNSAGYPTSCNGTGQGGELQAGADRPELRFIDNGGDSVSDALTGLRTTTRPDAGVLQPVHRKRPGASP